MWTETPRKKWANAEFSLVVCLQEFAQRWADHPGSQGSLDSLLSGSQNSIAEGIQRGERKAESLHMMDVHAPALMGCSSGLVIRDWKESPCTFARHNIFVVTLRVLLWLCGLKPVSYNLDQRSGGPSCSPRQFTSLRKYLLENSLCHTEWAAV